MIAKAPSPTLPPEYRGEGETLACARRAFAHGRGRIPQELLRVTA